jgi:hypothetical protein
MTKEEFEIAYRAMSRRRPFRPFLIEFLSGAQQRIVHPEALRSEPHFFVLRIPDGGFSVFTAAEVCRLFDQPPSLPS